MMQSAFFYFFSTLTVLSALGVIFSPKPTRALLSLIVTMSSLSCLYLSLGAPFVAMINLIVYAGAVLVLFLFVIMLQGIGAQDMPLGQRFPKIFLLSVFILTFVFVVALIQLTSSMTSSFSLPQGDAKAVGRLLFTNYLLPFELISILLIVAIFAAVSLAKREPGQ